MARESAKQRKRETAGIGSGDVIPGLPDTCVKKQKVSSRLGIAGANEGIDEGAKSALATQLLQKYQMMPDGAGHGGVLPIGDPELFGGLRTMRVSEGVVRVADERA